MRQVTHTVLTHVHTSKLNTPEIERRLEEIRYEWERDGASGSVAVINISLEFFYRYYAQH